MKIILQVFICGCLLFVTFNAIAAFTKRWTFDLVDMTTYTSNPDKIEMNFLIERIDRGHFGYSGFMDFKVDLDDNVLVAGTVKRSKDKEGPYRMMPLSIDNETLTDAMNKYYKLMVMSTVEKCCENAPVFRGPFVAPLTKRHVVMNKCVLSTESLPSVMMDGYYLLRVSLFAGDFDAYLEVLAYVENKY